MLQAMIMFSLIKIIKKTNKVINNCVDILLTLYNFAFNLVTKLSF